MKIALDATIVGLCSGDRGGVRRYIVNLIDQLKKIDHENQYILFFNFIRSGHRKSCNAFFQKVRGTNFKKVISQFPPPLRMRFRLPVEWFTGSIDIFHSPSHWLSPVKKARSIVTIHDMAYLKREKLEDEWRDGLKLNTNYRSELVRLLKERNRFFDLIEKYMPATIRQADRIITVSKATKNDLISVFPEAANKIRVIYEGVSSDFRPVKDSNITRKLFRKYSISTPYILFLGILDPNKNLLQLLRAFEVLKHEVKIPHQLIIAGRKTWFYEILNKKAKSLQIENHVIFTNHVDEDELISLYSNADVFVLPSHLEGFGIPVLEAMACGVPVVAANGGSLPEVVGDAGMLADPMDTESFVKAIQCVIEDTNLRKTLKEKGVKRCQDFSWEKMATKTFSLYKEVFAENRR